VDDNETFIINATLRLWRLIYRDVIVSDPVLDLLHFFESHHLIGFGQILLMLFLDINNIAVMTVGISVLATKCISTFTRKLSGQSHLFPANPTAILLFLNLLFGLWLLC